MNRKWWPLFSISCLLALLSHFVTPQTSTKPVVICLSPTCNCSSRLSAIYAKCSIRDLRNLDFFITNSTIIKNLDLTNNTIKEIPDGSFAKFTLLQNLSLSQNNIDTINNHSFKGLRHLEYLNLSRNPLKSYHGHPYHLISLKAIDITGAKRSIMSTKLLTLPKLKEIEGFSLTRECEGCAMTRLVNDSVPEALKKKKTKRWLKNSCSYIETVTDASIVEMANRQFLYTRCRGNKSLHSCLSSVSSTSQVKDACWKVTQQVLCVQYPIGIFSIIMNLMVILTIITSRLLLENVLFWFTLNLAIGDFLMSVYSISAAYLVHNAPNVDYYQTTCTKCAPIGFIWIISQVGIVSSSVLLTLERYLKTTFALKRHIRFEWKFAVILVLTVWLFGFAVALYFAFSGLLDCSYLCFIGNLYPESPSFAATAAVTVPQIILYLLILPIYVHIYIHVKNVGHQVGIRRESALAKKIALVVLTNVFFFILPLLVRGILIFSYERSGTPFEGPITKDKIANFLWVIFWNLNSCLNPLLNAYRNYKFKRVFRNRCYVVRKKVQDLLEIILSSNKIEQVNGSVEKGMVKSPNSYILRDGLKTC